MGTHKLINPDGSPYLTESDKRFEEISKKADDLIFRIQNMSKQLDICVIRVNQLEERVADTKKMFGRQLMRMNNG